ncbi:MAG: hypothetical protein NTW33_11145, partial [Methanoregula sp.]|nr:hypothetical protein [Methanoregula sp.]
MEERETGMDRPTRAATLTIRERLRDFSIHRPTVTALLITLIIVVFLLLPIWWMAGAWYEGQLITEERNSVAVDLSKYGSQLSQTLSRRISLVDGLSAFVLSDTSPESLNRTYNTFAAGLYTTTPGIRNFGVAPGGIQTYVYPLKGNENVPGHNLLTDNRSDVQESNQRMMESRRIDIRGPYELRQGGLGLVISRALFVNNTFWGFCSMVVDMPPILAEAGLSGQTGSLTLAVKNHDGKVFFGDPVLFTGDAVIQQFPVGTGTWEISGMPASGWSAPIQRALLMFRMTGLVIIGLIAGLVFLITKSYISVVIDLIERKRTEEALRESEKKYRMLFSNMQDGFAYCRMIFDSDGHPEDLIYLNVNCAFDQIIGIKNVTGKRFTEVFSGIRNAYPELFVIYGRVALTGTPESVEIDFKPIGKWLHISVYSPEKEYFVAVFEDITERKR